MMKISLNCKLDSVGAFGFIKPISDIKEIDRIDVFRDSEALKCKKVIYHASFKNQNNFIGHISKLVKMFITLNKRYELFIGIYEIPHGLFAYIMGKIYGVPVVISIIGNPSYSKVRTRIREKITYFMYKRIQAITVTGSKSKQVVVNNGIPKNNVYVLPNSIDVERFTPNKLIKKEFDLISLGRLSPEKELKNLLRIVVSLKLKRPDIRVAIAGKGPELEKLKEYIFKNKLTDNINLLGFVDNIVEFYNKGKIFVLTSSTEGLPRTVIEAMACGIPCVASKVGDLEDLIEDEVNGHLINDYKDLDRYAEKIDRLLSNESEYQLMSNKSIKEIRKNYSYSAATKVWNNIKDKIGGQ
ncbi:MAG: hypothetical protein CMF96_03695 [Candidatus Marinimicrobia bacterium]|nr:hypothetical protein [Candidatus Neomarinimicrobiota bacterium]